MSFILYVLGAVAMSFIIVAATLIVVAVIWLAISSARARIVEAGPDFLRDTKSLGEIIAASPDQPVHILFVHGIRRGDRGSSSAFRAGLCARLKLEPLQTGEKTERLDIGDKPDVAFMGEPVWPTNAAWEKGAFVDRYEYHAPGRPAPVFVDEVNWWPLALPLRLRALMAPEADLAGPDKTNLRFCALDDDVHYPFITQEQLKQLLATRPKGGGAALVNGALKRSLIDWGLSDSVIALGPMKAWLREAIDKAFEYARNAHAPDAPPKFVVVAESLGSFIVFDAYAAQKPSAQAVLDQTACLYFFANQITLHELGRLNVTASLPPAAALPAAPPHPAFHEALRAWAAVKAPDAAPALPPAKQIIAFSDPSDTLTFRVPTIAGATVVNLYDRNGLDFLHLVADPGAAHVGHSTNPKVLDKMLAVPR